VPVYTYKCEFCGDFDYHQSIRDTTLAYCPGCHGNVTKMFQAVGIKFNGSGFYSTDSKKK